MVGGPLDEEAFKVGGACSRPRGERSRHSFASRTRKAKKRLHCGHSFSGLGLDGTTVLGMRSRAGVCAYNEMYLWHILRRPLPYHCLRLLLPQPDESQGPACG